MSKLVEQCDIAPVKEVKPQDLDKYDLVGLGSPVWIRREGISSPLTPMGSCRSGVSRKGL